MRIHIGDSVIEVDEAQCVRVSRIIKDVMKHVSIDKFTDPRYYPPESEDEELVLRYFIFMVAIDHRTSRFKPFEGYVNGQLYHGADLLYRLGMLKFNEDPDFFNPKRMAKITVNEVKEWLSVKSANNVITIWDPEVRAELLKDLGAKLMRYYEGRVSNLLRSSRGMLKSPITYGLIDRLKVFKAYSDPVEKKAYLFVKFINRRNLFNYADSENAEVPVDNHLVRIALRLGIVRLRGTLQRKLIEGREFTYDEDIALRLCVRRAYKLIARIASIDPLLMDDFLWFFGRRCCTRIDPLCTRNIACKGLGLNIIKCPFIDICPASKQEQKISEHFYVNTYYY